MVTGAAGGIGQYFVEALLQRGARRVYASDLAGKTKMEMSMTLATPEAAEETRRFIKKAGGDSTWDRLAEFLMVVLRLSVLLHRGRSPQPLPEVQLKVKGRTVNMGLPQGWMKEHPLTLEDLEQERLYLKEAGFRLNIV